MDALAGQTQDSVPIGGSGDGELDVETRAQWWALPFARGDTVFIAVNASPGSALIPHLSLVGPSGSLIAQDENPISGQNALLRQFVAHEAGTYYARVSAQRGSVGAYTLIVGRLPATLEGQVAPTYIPTNSSATAPTQVPTSAPTFTPAAADPTAPGGVPLVRAGQSIESTLPDGEQHRYTLEGMGGMPLVIDLVALEGALDPYLELYGPEGEFLLENDDMDYGQMDARLEIRLPSTGTYTLIARSFGDRRGGAYRLSVQVGALWE